MTKRIRTYGDLLNEKKRLETLLQTQKRLLSNDVNELQQEIRPAIHAFSMLGKIFTRNTENVLITGTINWLIDLVVKKLVLSKSGWFTRQAVPFLMKNFSSHFIAEHKEVLMEKLFSWMGHKHSNGQASTDLS
jgi:hypothetical protein